MLMLSRRAKRK